MLLRGTLVICLLSALFCSPALSQQDSEILPSLPSFEPAPVAETTAAPEQPDTTAAAADPTTTTTTTTTVSPATNATTTTKATTTTTMATTTTKVTTTTTTPTPAPTPTPDPVEGRWSVSDADTGFVCIIAQMAAQMKVPYLTANNKTMTAAINVPSNASAAGSCDGSQYVAVQWPEGVSEDQANWLRLTFAENATSGRYSVESITAKLAINDDNFPDHASDQAALSLRVNFSEPIELSANTSYRCVSRQPFQLLTTMDQRQVSGQLVLLHTQFEAFRTVNSTKFSTPLVCTADHKAASDIVPIAVGVALALLVCIILIAYIVGRRRARQRGYQSV